MTIKSLDRKKEKLKIKKKETWVIESAASENKINLASVFSAAEFSTTHVPFFKFLICFLKSDSTLVDLL